MNIEKFFSFLLEHPYFDHTNNLKNERWANEILHETIAKHHSFFRIRRLLKVDYDE